MYLEKLLDDISISRIDFSFKQLDIRSICCDSQKVTSGALFIALKGSKYNGSEFIRDAIGHGATAVACEENVENLKKEHQKICFFNVDDSKKFLLEVTQCFYGNPSQQVKTIGITGTNGKTTVAYLIESIFVEAGLQSGVIGTVNYRMGGKSRTALNTTPDYAYNQHFLSLLEKNNIPYCIMEVSSHALDQSRVDGIDFRLAVFTNLTSDHLDYHKSREHYFSAKALLFSQLDANSIAVINTDDIYGQQLCSMTEAKIMTFGIEHQADVMAKDIHMDILGSRFILQYAQEEIEVKTALIGNFNIYNILAAITAGVAEGIKLDVIKKGIERLACVPGRLEKVNQGQKITIFIDYAHTQDALENVLTTIRNVTDARIILVFGCGGDRDISKRPLMGKTACQLADVSFVTSDNPRSEDPGAIIDQIISGFDKDNYHVVIDREEAICRALDTADSSDLVLVAGKGHEDYQVIAGKKIAFNEFQIIKNYFHSIGSINADAARKLPSYAAKKIRRTDFSL